MGVVAKLMRLLPNAVYDKLARNAPRKPLQHFPFAALHADAIDADVQQRGISRRIQRHARRMAPDDVQHAAVRKQQDAFAVVAAGDVVHGGDHARLELAQRFTAIQWAQGVTAFPGGRGLGGLHVDTVVVQAFQHAKAALADAGLHASLL
ncbi:hypothetical protein G6F68_014942 [Rhizopus microsporus]|nr:hypothetical protein G6F68_014942 [Rhizopus microsporus]